MTAKLSHRTAVAELVAAIVKAPRTMRELREMTDMSDETVNAWVREFMASGVVYVADYRKNATGCDSPVYGWVRDDEASVLPPGLATNPTAVAVRTNYRLRQRARRHRVTSAPVSAEARAWAPRLVDERSPHIVCSLCSKRTPQLGCRWYFTGLERVRVCGPCMPVAAEIAA